MAAPQDRNRFVKFNVPQAKRVVDATRTVERAKKDGVFAAPNMTVGRQLQNQTMWVRCTIDGGSAGETGLSDCSWTYTVTTMRGNVTLGELMEPVFGRLPLLEYATTGAGALGLAGYDEDGVFFLGLVDELPVCT